MIQQRYFTFILLFSNLEKLVKVSKRIFIFLQSFEGFYGKTLPLWGNTDFKFSFDCPALLNI